MTAPLAAMPAVGLDEIVAVADLQVRRDRKYLLPAEVAHELIGGVPARALEIDRRRRFRYESIYFDTPGWDSYLGAARRRPRRFKVRTRSYLDSGGCLLEVKVRDHRGNTVKHRTPYHPSTRDRLTADGRAFVGSVAPVRHLADHLSPSLTVSYVRSTLLLDGGCDRVTIDDDAVWSTADGTTMGLDGLTIVETKTAGPPCALDRLLWRARYRPVSISKYGTGMALIRRDLPSNKWYRVLRRQVLPNVTVRSGSTALPDASARSGVVAAR